MSKDKDFRGGPELAAMTTPSGGEDTDVESEDGSADSTGALRPADHDKEMLRRVAAEDSEKKAGIMVFSAPGGFVKDALVDHAVSFGFKHDAENEYAASMLQSFFDKKKDSHEQIYQHVFKKINEARTSGVITDLKPRRDDDETIIYAHENGSKLQQIEQNGQFSFNPDSGFTGVVTIERIGNDGKLTDKHVDIIEYRDGKPTVLILAKEGKSRLKDIALMQQQIAAGINVSAVRSATPKTTTHSPAQSLSTSGASPPNKSDLEEIAVYATTPDSTPPGRGHRVGVVRR